MSSEAPRFPEDAASEPVTFLAFKNGQGTVASERTTFFSLPRELRDLVYSYVFHGVYTQVQKNYRRTRSSYSYVTGLIKARPSDRHAIVWTSRRLWEESSRILYGECVFHIHVGSTNCDNTLITPKVADLMQIIEISLGPSKALDSARILRFFGTSRIVRSSCFIRLQFREIEMMSDFVIGALKQLTGFKILRFEMHAPKLIYFDHSGVPIPWFSGLLAHIKACLDPELGPSVYVNGDDYRRLVYKPQSNKS